MDKPIRILNVFGELNRGGAETFVMNVYRNLDKQRIQFDFLVHSESEGTFEKEIIQNGGKIYRVPNLSIKNIFIYLKDLDAFFAEHSEYSIIHNHLSETGLFVMRSAKKSGIKSRICHAHSVSSGINSKTFVRFIMKKFIRCYSTINLACSAEAGKWLYGKNSYKIIHNGIDFNMFVYLEENRNKIREELNITNKFVIGHVGRFVLQKNHIFLINVFEKIKKENDDAMLVLIGEGVLLDRIKEIVQQKQLENSVIYLGSLQNVNQYYSAFDVFVFPSKYEGLGISLIEAQVSGLPCFASNTVSKETCISKKIYYLPILKKSISEWGNRILSFDMKQTRDREDLLDFAYEYDIKKVVLELEKLYFSIL